MRFLPRRLSCMKYRREWGRDPAILGRFCLNLKRIKYRTEWVEYPDIEKHCRERGIEPTPIGDSGNTKYTSPAIHDTSTGVYLSGSERIAEYLDRTYSNEHLIFPVGSVGLQRLFEEAYAKRMDVPRAFVVPRVMHILTPTSRPFFRETREVALERPLENVLLSGSYAEEQWEKVDLCRTWRDCGVVRYDAWPVHHGQRRQLGGFRSRRASDLVQ